MLTFDVAIIIVIIIIILHTSWMSCPVDPTHFTIFAPLSFYPLIPYCLLPFSVIFTTDPLLNPYPFAFHRLCCLFRCLIYYCSVTSSQMHNETNRRAGIRGKTVASKKSIKKNTHTQRHTGHTKSRENNENCAKINK